MSGNNYERRKTALRVPGQGLEWGLSQEDVGTRFCDISGLGSTEAAPSAPQIRVRVALAVGWEKRFCRRLWSESRLLKCRISEFKLSGVFKALSSS